MRVNGKAPRPLLGGGALFSSVRCKTALEEFLTDKTESRSNRPGVHAIERGVVFDKAPGPIGRAPLIEMSCFSLNGCLRQGVAPALKPVSKPETGIRRAHCARLIMMRLAYFSRSPS